MTLYTPKKINEAPDPGVIVAVCIPSQDQVAMPFAKSFASMMQFLGATVVADGVMSIFPLWLAGTYIDRSRSTLVRLALSKGATHLLWLDTDMTFPKDALLRLMGHNADIVGVNYSKRRQPLEPTAIKRLDADKQIVSRLYSAGCTGTEEVDAIGFGCVLVRAEVFEKVPPPGFRTIYSEKHAAWIGEDTYFCEKARKAGFKVLVDHDLSNKVGHVGSFEYTNEHAEVVRIAEQESRLITDVHGVLA